MAKEVIIMVISLFLAKIIGLYIMLVTGALLINRKNVDLLFGLYRHPETVYLSGVLDTILGIVLILIHNVWVMNFQAIITLVGWGMLVRGVSRMLFPAQVTTMLEKFRQLKRVMMPLLVIIFLVGAYLAYMGFTR